MRYRSRRETSDLQVSQDWVGWPTTPHGTIRTLGTVMSGLRFWRSSRWRNVFQVDSDLAEAEGLAAGTGLLTGSLVDETDLPGGTCPRCDAEGEVISIDLLDGEVVRRCRTCAHSWATHAPDRIRPAS